MRLTNSNLTERWVNISINNRFILNFWAQVTNNSFGLPMIPLHKGQNLKIDYGTSITGASVFSFYYSVGSEPTA